MGEGVAIYEAVDGGEDFVFTDYNKAGQSMDGVARDDAIGKTVTEVFPGIREFGLLEVFRRVWRTGEPERHPVCLYEDDELAFYDALAQNVSAVQVMGIDELKVIACELVRSVRQGVTIDWTVRESARARIRVVVRRILRKHGYPPDLQAEATKLVLEQAEALCKDWAA